MQERVKPCLICDQPGSQNITLPSVITPGTFEVSACERHAHMVREVKAQRERGEERR